MILVEQITPVAKLLLDAAISRRTVSFKAFHALFEPDALINDKYETLEAASRALCANQIAIYGAVLAKSGTGCPGDGFFDAFKNTRPDEYKNHAGDSLTLDLNEAQMFAITLPERERVYEHAESNF